MVQELSAAPEDEDLQAVLRVELRKILERDPVLRGEIAKLLNTGTTTRVSVRGKKNVAAGRDITGSTIVHGDYLRASLSETEAQIAAFANAGVLLKLLMVVGVLVMLAGFAVFMSFIFSGANADPSQDVDITPAAIGMGMMLSGGILSSLAYIVARLADPT